MERIKRSPLPVTRSNPWDKIVVQMSMRGFYGDVIAQHAGLSLSQVRYRQEALDCKPNDFRRGRHPAARKAIQSLHQSYGHLTDIRRLMARVENRRKQRA